MKNQKLIFTNREDLMTHRHAFLGRTKPCSLQAGIVRNGEVISYIVYSVLTAPKSYPAMYIHVTSFWRSDNDGFFSPEWITKDNALEWWHENRTWLHGSQRLTVRNAIRELLGKLFGEINVSLLLGESDVSL